MYTGLTPRRSVLLLHVPGGIHLATVNPDVLLSTYRVTVYIYIYVLRGNVQLPHITSHYRISYKLCVTFVTMYPAICNVNGNVYTACMYTQRTL